MALKWQNEAINTVDNAVKTSVLLKGDNKTMNININLKKGDIGASEIVSKGETE